MFEIWRERRREQQRNPAQRRYVRRFLPMMAAYVVILFAVTAYFRDHHPTGALLVLLSVLPALPLLGAIGVIGVYLSEERDEFVRHRLVLAMIGGTGVLLAITTVWGFLEMNAVVPHFPTFLAFPLFCAAFGLIQCAMGVRDRMTGERP
jgi:heme A synthase